MTKMRTRHMYGVEVEAASQTIQWVESAVPLSATIAVGTYWACSGAIAGYPSLYDAIAAAMTAESLASGDSNTYVIEVATPTLSTAQIMAGVRIRETGGAAWSLTRLCAINGLGVLGISPSGSAQLASSGGIVTSEWTSWGAWVPPLDAEEWRRMPERNVALSTDETERTDAYAVYGGERWIRSWVWRRLVAGHVIASRAAEADYATSAALATGDTLNAYSDLWRWASRGGKVITTWWDDAAGIDITIPLDAYEIGRYAEVEQARRLAAVVRLIEPRGEYYDIEARLSRVQGGYAQ